MNENEHAARREKIHCNSFTILSPMLREVLSRLCLIHRRLTLNLVKYKMPYNYRNPPKRPFVVLRPEPGPPGTGELCRKKKETRKEKGISSGCCFCLVLNTEPG